MILLKQTHFHKCSGIDCGVISARLFVQRQQSRSLHLSIVFQIKNPEMIDLVICSIPLCNYLNRKSISHGTAVFDYSDEHLCMANNFEVVCHRKTFLECGGSFFAEDEAAIQILEPQYEGGALDID
jgi:hypothetical protein